MFGSCAPRTNKVVPVCLSHCALLQALLTLLPARGRHREKAQEQCTHHPHQWVVVICIQTYPTVECKQPSLKLATELPTKHFLGGGKPHILRLIQLFFKLTLIFPEMEKLPSCIQEEGTLHREYACCVCWKRRSPHLENDTSIQLVSQPTVQSPRHSDSVLFTPYFFSSLGDRAGQEG